MLTSFRSLAGLAAVGFSVASASAVEPPVQKIDPSQPVGAIVQEHDRAASMMTPHENDERIVRWLSIDNKGLVACGKMAFDHATNESVKQFAKRVADDHERFQNSFAAKRDDANPDVGAAAPAAKAAEPQAALIRDEGRSRDGAMIFRPTDFVAVKERICDEMQSKFKKEMDQLAGPQYDHAFLSHSVFGHEAMIASIDVLRSNASQDLEPKLKELREMTASHLEEARRLQADLRSPVSAGRPAAAEQK